MNARYGGPGAGVADLATVEAAVAKPAAGVVDREFFPTTWDKAAALLSGLARSQGFIDGNKRTAWVATASFLNINKMPLREVHYSVAASFVLAVSVGLLEHEDIVQWLRDGIGTDWPKTPEESAGWADPKEVHFVFAAETFAGGASWMGEEVTTLDLGIIKFATFEKGHVPRRSDADVPDLPTRRFTFALMRHQLDALIKDLRAMRGRIGTPSALPRTSTNTATRSSSPRSGVRNKNTKKKKKRR